MKMSNQYYYFQLFSYLTKIEKRLSNASFVKLNDCRQGNYVKHMQSFLLTVEHLKFLWYVLLYLLQVFVLVFGQMEKILGSTTVNRVAYNAICFVDWLDGRLAL